MYDSNTNETPAYDHQATIVVRGKYDYEMQKYAGETVTAAQASEAFTAAEFLGKRNDTMKSQIQSVKEYLIECLADESIDPDVAQEIAGRLDIELTKNLRVEFTVRYSAIVTVPLDSDLDESDFDVRIDSSADGDWNDEDWDIEDFSAEEIDSF